MLNYEEGAENSILHGDPASEAALTEGATASVVGRDLAAESMFMYGSRAGFWRLHRMFTKRNISCTIFAVARALERNPEAAAAKAIVRTFIPVSLLPVKPRWVRRNTLYWIQYTNTLRMMRPFSGSVKCVRKIGGAR